MPIRIVVPVDGSKLSTAAVAWAVAFARRTGGAVAVCSVVDPMLACMAGAGGAAIDPGPMLETLDADAAAFCASAVALAAAQHVSVLSAILHGQPATEIDAFALADRADFIVLGTHARQGLARGILGSVTAAVVQTSAIAVIAVRAATLADDAGPIVVAVDDSQASVAAARYALEIAQALAVPIHLVHVRAVQERTLRETRNVLEILAREATSAAVICTTEIRPGDVVAVLNATIAEYGASLLATGTHGRNAVGRFFLGSVAEALVRSAVVPVLMVRNASRINGLRDGTHAKDRVAF